MPKGGGRFALTLGGYNFNHGAMAFVFPFSRGRVGRGWSGLALLALASLVVGCLPAHLNRPLRPMTVGQDTFAFANELKWEYTYNPATGKMDHRPRRPSPKFTNRCVPMARAARQFLFHSTFEPQQPPVGEAEYARLVKQVLARSPHKVSSPSHCVSIPGYTNLHDFSAAHPEVLQRAIGGAWQSYVQSRNWRMVFPFSRKGQEKLFEQLCQSVSRHAYFPPIVHAVTFPSLALNHVVVVTATAEPGEVRRYAPGVEPVATAVYFMAYDPNTPEQPLILWYEREERRFYFPRTDYFQGGPVNLYLIYRVKSAGGG